MVSRLVLAVAIIVATSCAPAWAGEAPMICRAPSVLDLMARDLRQHDYYARIDPRLTEEFSGPVADSVQCSVAVVTLRYDPPLAGNVPLGHCESHVFQVRAVANGFVVRYLR
jgi:hypothetical protein